MLLPDGPKTPALWQMIHWIANPFSFMHRCSEKYGDCFTAKLGQNFAPIVFVSNPQSLQTILTSDPKEIDAPGELNVLFEPFLGTQSVIGLSGDRHRRMRQLMMPPFHGERMRSYGQIISDITEKVIQQWQIGESFSVRKSMQAISMQAILSAVFGLNEGQRYQRLDQLLTTMLDEMSNPFSVSLVYFKNLQQDFGSFSPWGKFVRKRQQVDQLIYDEIAERRANPDPSRSDILTLLMSARDEAGEPLTDVELRDELMTLLVAGHETTATAITWALYWIHKLPAVRAQLLQELQELDEPLDPNAIFRLPYLSAVCSEALRIYPVGMLIFPRLVKSPIELEGHHLEPGTILVGSIYLAHHCEDVYPEADTFKPERFLERQFSPYEYLPFGGGSRRCIGMAFALFEMKVVLAKIMMEFDLELANSHPAYPIRRGLVSAPSSVKFVTKARKPKVGKSQASSENAAKDLAQSV